MTVPTMCPRGCCADAATVTIGSVEEAMSGRQSSIVEFYVLCWGLGVVRCVHRVRFDLRPVDAASLKT